MATMPSQQEIEDYLAGLNRIADAYAGASAGSTEARRQGLKNYFQWFEKRRIALFKDSHDHLWKLKESGKEHE